MNKVRKVISCLTLALAVIVVMVGALFVLAGMAFEKIKSQCLKLKENQKKRS